MRSSPAWVRRRYRRSPGLVFSDPTSSSLLRAVKVSEPLMSRPRWAMRLARTVACRSACSGLWQMTNRCARAPWSPSRSPREPRVSPLNRDGSQVLVDYNSTGTQQHFSVQVGKRHVTENLAAGAAATYRWNDPGKVAATGAELGWINLDLGAGPAGTPGGRLGNQWLAYSQPYGAELRGSGAPQDLSRAGWTLAASSTEPASPLANLTDGDLTTRWSSGIGQGPGSWVSVDLGSAQEFNQVVMNSGTSPGDYVRTYHVETSPDGVTWTAVTRGQGSSGEMVIPLPPTTTRHLRIASEASSGSWWSINELNLRTSPAGATVPVAPPGQMLVRASGVLSGGTAVTGVYNAGRKDAQVDFPISGFGFVYWLPPTAAVTLAGSPAK